MKQLKALFTLSNSEDLGSVIITQGNKYYYVKEEEGVLLINDLSIFEVVSP